RGMLAVRTLESHQAVPYQLLPLFRNRLPNLYTIWKSVFQLGHQKDVSIGSWHVCAHFPHPFVGEFSRADQRNRRGHRSRYQMMHHGFLAVVLPNSLPDRIAHLPAKKADRKLQPSLLDL